MQRAKAFFYVSLGILALAFSFHLGAQTAQSQAPGNPVVATGVGGGGPLDVYVQFVIQDPGQALGYALSNAVMVELLP